MEIVLERRDGVYLMEKSGTGVRLLARHGTDPICTPSEDRILFLAWADGRYDIHAIDRTGANPVPITRGVDVLQPFTVSPGGDAVAFVSRRDQQLYTVSVDGSGLTRLTTDFARVYRPAWSPDGGHIAFYGVTDGPSRVEGLFAIEAVSRRIKTLTVPALLGHGHSWSPDGKNLAVAGYGQLRLIHVYDQTVTVIVRDHPGIRFMSWSPDGKTLAFESEEGACSRYRGAIHTVRVDGSNIRKVSARWPCRRYYDPHWSPEGDSIMFLGTLPKGDMNLNPFSTYIWPNLYVVNADGSDQRNLTGNKDVEDRSPRWCARPRGSR